MTFLRLVCLASFPFYFTRPLRGLLWYFVTAALWSRGGAGGSFGAALYPTVSHCAESSTPLHSLCGIGFISYDPFGLVPGSVSAFIISLLPDFLVGRPFVDGPRGQVTAPPPFFSLTFVAATTHTW